MTSSCDQSATSTPLTTVPDYDQAMISSPGEPVPPRLPMEVLLRVVENACYTKTWNCSHGLDPDDEVDVRKRRIRHLKRRYRNLKQFMLVCRDWYSTVLPLFYSQVVFFGDKGSIGLFEEILDNRPALDPRNPSHHYHKFGCYVRLIDLSFVTTRSVFLEPIFTPCQNLHTVFFGDAFTPAFTASDWHDWYRLPNDPLLKSVRMVHLPHSRSETAAFLDVLNDIPGLEELSMTSMCLQVDLSASLIEIFRMNALLPSHKTGIRGPGMRSLSFGAECDLPYTLISALPRVCPNLKSFHLLAGANVQSATPIDLDTFVASFPSSLRAFSFLADATLQFNASFDRALESQPGLEYLHVRSDFISLDFFLRLPPSTALSHLQLDLASVIRAESPIPWHLTLSLNTHSRILNSISVAREFRRVGLAWTLGSVRAFVVRRLIWASQRDGFLSTEEEREREREMEADRCACDDSEGESETGAPDSDDEDGTSSEEETDSEEDEEDISDF
ncbi:hypothetical protein T439DRAFT_360835 [Meredithblackwellia eburnea MCA 4105]